MGTSAGAWRDAIDEMDAALIDGYQSGVPVVERPFRAIGSALGIDEHEAFDRVERLLEEGIFRRFGPVLNPPVIGSSTLAALQAPDARFDEIAATVNGYRQVNHNYARNHEWNMWFVVTAGSRIQRDEIIAEIEAETGCDVLVLPMLTDYYIDLEFPVVNTDRYARESIANDADVGDADVGDSIVDPPESRSTGVCATRISEDAVADLTQLEADLLLSVQEGFPLSLTPYGDVSADLDVPTEQVLAATERLCDRGCIKRIGCVVNHVKTGFDANCMVVWDVPDDERDARGERVGALPYVTLCYHRPRRPDMGWPYNLFTMIHGREADIVDAKIDELAAEYLPYDHARLYSTETLKQTGARYESLLSDSSG